MLTLMAASAAAIHSAMRRQTCFKFAVRANVMWLRSQAAPHTPTLTLRRTSSAAHRVHEGVSEASLALVRVVRALLAEEIQWSALTDGVRGVHIWHCRFNPWLVRLRSVVVASLVQCATLGSLGKKHVLSSVLQFFQRATSCHMLAL